jgi:2-aminoadipate transaminase
MRNHLARRSRAFEVSPWSAAADLVGRHPDPIYFGNGAPAVDAQPIERLQWAAERAWADVRGSLDYGELEGYLPLRELIAERMTRRGISAGVNDIMVTNGSQQGIDLIARLYLDPGDSIVVEGPTYIGAMQTFDAYEANYLTCSIDEQGLCVDELERILMTAEPVPKLIYTVPTFQNPTGFSLSGDRRARMIELADAYDVLILEDDPYGEIYFGNQPPDPALRALSGRVVYLGSFSKIIAPGIRVGWTVAPPELMKLLLMAKEGTDIHSNRVMTRTVYHAATGFLDGHVASIRDLYRTRRDTLSAGLSSGMPDGVVISQPDGGFFIWCELPGESSADELLRFAADFGVAFLPGSWFYPPGAAEFNGMRLSYSSLPIDRLEEGARRLGAATTAFLAGRE